MSLTVGTQTLKSPTTWRNNKLRAVIFLLGLLVLFTNEFNKFDTLIYDFLLSNNPPVVEKNAVIIAIDDKSINEIGRWPWSRDVHATLLNTLETSKAKAIGFDILFTEADKEHPVRDTNFATAIEKNNNVVLAIAPLAPQKSITSELIPFSILADKSAALGHVDLEVDGDGFVRSLYLFAGWKESKWPSFSLALARLAKPDKTFETTTLTIGNYWTRRQPILIPYTSTSGSIPIYSYIDVLNKNVDINNFKNKVVIVGLTATGLSERFTTPFSSNHQNMTGVEINAHIVNGLINDKFILKTEPWISHSIKFVIILLSLLCAYFISNLWLIPSLIAQILLSIGVSAFLLFGFNLWFEPALMIVAQVLIYCLTSFIHTKNNHKTIAVLEKHIGYDPVTLLPTQQQLKKNIVKALRQSNGSLNFAIVVINIGKFKDVNELLGFKAGDHLLNIASTRINTCIDHKHECARYNGPEFTIFFKDVSSQEQLSLYCDALYELLGKPYQIQNERFILPISIGASFYPEHANKIDDLFDAAITAMQKAKKQTDRGVCYYDQTIKLNIIEHNKLINDLHNALEREEIEIYYQPQVTAKEYKIIGVEALVRWNHPQRGLIQPDDFIPIAESTGLIIPIGNWILQNACLHLKNLHEAGHHHLKLAVNLSTVQFSAPDLIEQVAYALNNAQISAHDIELELTESCLMKDIDKAIGVLNKLKGMGIRLSIDDFGTGYSSLSYLKQFPIDRIKIDRLFVSELDTSIDAKEITLAIISMAHSLKMSVIAEGVETVEQQNFLDNNNCEELQGFYFSKPITQNDLRKLLDTATTSPKK
ncbi:EAL domain-containing protein [Colwellia sp. UCD-KL20]|uniref:EAL domain-containing protein n=1 Tax=Colwellia sp. UCD-KL20 TaxID=1917165 RepID=UPI000970664F|nr:EAL domain-containing protein [Colwellia sp. UCD-KL20]